MSIDKEALVDYRISRSKETYDEALLLATKFHWNTVANRLYYSCYYMVNALLIKNNLDYSSHNGVKTEFHKSFVKIGLVSIDTGKIYSRLFNLRHEGDYIDFQRLEDKSVEPFIQDVATLLSEIESLINK